MAASSPSSSPSFRPLPEIIPTAELASKGKSVSPTVRQLPPVSSFDYSHYLGGSSLSDTLSPASVTLSSERQNFTLPPASREIFMYTEDDKLCKYPQVPTITHNGKLYVEATPGFNIVYMDKRVPLRKVVGKLPVSKKSKYRNRMSGRPKKPGNPFIMYRSARLDEMTALYPAVNQTEISRMLADSWRKEQPHVKKYFKDKYNEAMETYLTMSRLAPKSPELPYIELQRKPLSIVVEKHLPLSETLGSKLYCPNNNDHRQDITPPLSEDCQTLTSKSQENLSISKLLN